MDIFGQLDDKSFGFCDIPQGTTSIGDCAFWGCSRLRIIHIPHSVTKIGKEAFDNRTTVYAPHSPAYYGLGLLHKKTNWVKTKNKEGTTKS